MSEAQAELTVRTEDPDFAVAAFVHPQCHVPGIVDRATAM